MATNGNAQMVNGDTAAPQVQNGHDNAAAVTPPSGGVERQQPKAIFFKDIDVSDNAAQPMPAQNTVRVIGSYNWCKGKPPTIIVPGEPMELNITRHRLRLHKTGDYHFIDENHHRMPNWPLEALFRSVQHCSPDFNFKNVDVISDRSNLRRLLAVTSGQYKESFRIDGQMINNTMAFVQCEKQDAVQDHSYGFNFEDRVSHPRAPIYNGCSYRSIVTFKSCGLRLVVRGEIDAFDFRRPEELEQGVFKPKPRAPAAAKEASSKTSAAAEKDVDAEEEGPSDDDEGCDVELEDDDSETEESASNSKRQPRVEMDDEAAKEPGPERQGQRCGPDTPLHLIARGKMAGNGAAVELKTRSMKTGMQWSDVWGQMFFSQIAALYIGWHENGTVHQITRHTLQEVGRNANKGLPGGTSRCVHRLVGLLRMIRKAVQEFNTDQFTLLYNDLQGGVVRIVPKYRHKQSLPPSAFKALGLKVPVPGTLPDRQDDDEEEYGKPVTAANVDAPAAYSSAVRNHGKRHGTESAQRQSQQPKGSQKNWTPLSRDVRLMAKARDMMESSEPEKVQRKRKQVPKNLAPATGQTLWTPQEWRPRFRALTYSGIQQLMQPGA